jgi:hypothetical protein
VRPEDLDVGIGRIEIVEKPFSGQGGEVKLGR